MSVRKKTIIEYKYEGGPWQTYDETFVTAWAENQERQARLEHPLAMVRTRPAEKKVKK